MLRRLLPLSLAGILLACGGSGDSETATRDTEPAAAVDAAPVPATESATEPPASGAVVADVPEALRFSAPLVGGGDIELTTLAGRPVLLWFWAPW